jgi:hypothetical protein
VDSASIQLTEKLENNEKQKRARLRELSDRVAAYDKEIRSESSASGLRHVAAVDIDHQSSSNNTTTTAGGDDVTNNNADDEVVAMINVQACVTPPRKKTKKGWTKRPDNWKIIGEYYHCYGHDSTLKVFEAELGWMKRRTSRVTALKRWMTDWQNGREPKDTRREPILGIETERRILQQLLKRSEVGLSIGDDDLRRVVLDYLAQSGRTCLLRENGGNNTFGSSFCSRFWKRHRMSSRIATTKMRDDIPKDFATKLETYERIGSYYIEKYGIPRELWINADETNILFCMRASRTRAQEGTKRIRIIGMGKDKAQITCTLAVAGDGELLPYQLIFNGKTDRSHPSDISNVLKGSVVTHTESHWQTPKTFKEYLVGIIVMYKNDKIKRLGLPEDSWTLFTIDLHYSHKNSPDINLSELARSYRVILLYIPAGCTDIIQVCDTIINKTFKCGVKRAFQFYLHTEYEKYKTGCETEEEVLLWKPNLNAGHLKQFMINWINVGMDAMTSDDFKASIRDSAAVTVTHSLANLTPTKHVQAVEVNKIQQQNILFD